MPLTRPWPIQAADRAQAAGNLTGWVNNAAVFRDAALDVAPVREVLDLIMLNLAPAVVGSATRDPPVPHRR